MKTIRFLSDEEYNILYYVLRYSNRNPSEVGLEECDLKIVNDLFKELNQGSIMISEKNNGI